MERFRGIREITPPRWVVLAVAPLVAIGLLAATALPASAAAVVLLSTYHGDLARDGFVSGSKITKTNAGTLGLAWTYAADRVISNQPAVVNGITYWGDWGGYEHAASTTRGTLWSTFLGTTTDAQCSPRAVGIASSPSVGTLDGVETLWTGDGDGSVSALNASTGKIVWKTTIAPRVGGYIWSSPALYAGSVFIGVASLGDCPLVRGRVVKLNAATGAVQAISYTAPQNCIGSGVWSSPAVDTTTGTVYVTTGNANCTTRLQNAILRLSAATLGIQAYWQIPQAQWIVDGDWGSSPTLFSGSIGGVLHQLVGSAAKNGIFYALDRNKVAAGPVWTVAIANGGGCPQCGKGSISPAAFDGTTLYAAGGSVTIKNVACRGSVDALVPGSGHALWRDCLQGGTVLAAITMVPGVLFVADGPQLIALAAAGGARLFSYIEPGGGVFYGPATVAGADVWIGNSDGSLREFAVPT